MLAAVGNDLDLGFMAGRGSTLKLSAEARATHFYCCGATGTGKSKMLEHLIRQDIKAWRKSKCGVLLLDPHGSLYDGLMSWLAWNQFDCPIIPIDLRRDDWVIAYNVLRQRHGGDPGVIVGQLLQAMAHVGGGEERTIPPSLSGGRTPCSGRFTKRNSRYLKQNISLTTCRGEFDKLSPLTSRTAPRPATGVWRIRSRPRTLRRRSGAR